MQNIQSKIVVALTSWTTYVVLATFLYNLLNSNIGLFPTDWSILINVLLGILAVIAHSGQVQNAAVMGSTKVGSFKA